MKFSISGVEYRILSRLVDGPVPQKTIVAELAAITGEQHTYTKIRELCAKEMLIKTREGSQVWIEITPLGRNALSIMTAVKEAGL
jgi:predicted transcriptional regulator